MLPFGLSIRDFEGLFFHGNVHQVWLGHLELVGRDSVITCGKPNRVKVLSESLILPETPSFEVENTCGSVVDISGTFDTHVKVVPCDESLLSRCEELNWLKRFVEGVPQLSVSRLHHYWHTSLNSHNNRRELRNKIKMSSTVHKD